VIHFEPILNYLTPN